MNKLALLPAVLATGLALATACGGNDASLDERPEPSASEQTHAARTTRTPEPTPEATSAPPAGWTRHTTAGFEVDLPDRWESWDPSKETAEAVIEALGAGDPEQAEAVKALFAGQEGSDWALAAIDTESPVEFLTNFLVFEQESPLPMTVRAAIAQSEEQVHEFGLTLVSSDAELLIGGAKAGRIEYAMPCPCEEGHEVEAREVDYIVLPEPTRGFLLTFAASAQDYPALEPTFRRIAESFRVVERD